MNKNVMIGILVVAIIAIAGYFYMKSTAAARTNPEDKMMQENSGEDQMKKDESGESMMQEGSTDAMMPKDDTTMMKDDKDTTDGTMMANVKNFTIVAKPYSFTPATIKVKKGDTVKITLQNEKGTHDLVIDEFNVSTKIINTGESDTVEFTADKTGTFEYYCSVSNHRAMGMVGKLIVE